jgi:hypothetical protein
MLCHDTSVVFFNVNARILSSLNPFPRVPKLSMTDHDRPAGRHILGPGGAPTLRIETLPETEGTCLIHLDTKGFQLLGFLIHLQPDALQKFLI